MGEPTDRGVVSQVVLLENTEDFEDDAPASDNVARRTSSYNHITKIEEAPDEEGSEVALTRRVNEAAAGTKSNHHTMQRQVLHHKEADEDENGDDVIEKTTHIFQ